MCFTCCVVLSSVMSHVCFLLLCLFGCVVVVACWWLFVCVACFVLFYMHTFMCDCLCLYVLFDVFSHVLLYAVVVDAFVMVVRVACFVQV